MTAMCRVTILIPEGLWGEMAMAAAVRDQTRGEYARAILERETDAVLSRAGMKKEAPHPMERTEPMLIPGQARPLSAKRSVDEEVIDPNAFSPMDEYWALLMKGLWIPDAIAEIRRLCQENGVKGWVPEAPLSPWTEKYRARCEAAGRDYEADMANVRVPIAGRPPAVLGRPALKPTPERLSVEEANRQYLHWRGKGMKAGAAQRCISWAPLDWVPPPYEGDPLENESPPAQDSKENP